MRTVVGIPTLGMCDMLDPLVDELHRQGGYDELLLIDNTESGQHTTRLRERHPHCATMHIRGSLYRCWNFVWQRAAAYGDASGKMSNAVLLNDDIEIPPDFVHRLCAMMRTDPKCWCAYPNYRLPLDQDDPFTIRQNVLTPTKGTYKDGGLWGCAFALRGEVLNAPVPPIDERFEFWYGDDDLVTQIDRHGGLTCRVEGLALYHAGSQTYSRSRELQEAAARDTARWAEKYGVDA